MSLVPQNAHDSLCKHKHSDPALKISSEIRKIPCRWQAPNPGLLVVPLPQVASRDQGSPPWSGARKMSEHTVSISLVSIDKVQRHCNPMGHQTGKRIPLLRTLESSRPPSKEHWEWGRRSTLFPAGSSSARIKLATPECGLFTMKNKRQ